VTSDESGGGSATGQKTAFKLPGRAIDVTANTQDVMRKIKLRGTKQFVKVQRTSVVVAGYYIHLNFPEWIVYFRMNCRQCGAGSDLPY
jgi:hypothetical protein